MFEEDNAYPFESACRAFVQIADATDENEVTIAFGNGMRALQEIAKNAYARIQRDRASGAYRDIHDAAVKAAGGE